MDSGKAVIVMVLAGLFFLLGWFFILAPEPASHLFGLPAEDGLGFVRALGFRDVALALYLSGLLLMGERRALSFVLAASALIPAGDVALVALLAGSSSTVSLILHAAGGAALLGAAALARPR